MRQRFETSFPYSFTEEAAAEARRESRRHWQAGGEVDRKYPIHVDVKRWWKIRKLDRDEIVAASIERMRGKR